MNQGKLVFAQVTQLLPLTSFRRCVARYDREHKVKTFSRLDQFLCMAFAQLTYRESLRDIEASLRAQRSKLYHMGIRSVVSRNTLANANAVRDWWIYADYALDATTIDLCLSVFPWAPFRSTKAAVKLHTLLDLRGNIPSFIHISDGKLHDVNILDQRIPEPGVFYIMDRGYVDFERRYSHPVDRTTGLICDQPIVQTVYYSHKGFDAPLRRIRFKDPKTGKTLVCLTNNLRAGRHSQEAASYRCQSLPFSKNPQPHHVRENPIGSTT